MTTVLAMPLLAVALSLQSATDYALTAPVLSNGIEGVGMKTANGRKLLRSEDFAFLKEAVAERMACVFLRDMSNSWDGVEMGDSPDVRGGAPIGYGESVVPFCFPANDGRWNYVPYYNPGGYVHKSFTPRRTVIVSGSTDTNQDVFAMMDNATLFVVQSNLTDAATLVFPVLETGSPVAFTNIQCAYATLAAFDTIVTEGASLNGCATNIQRGVSTSRSIKSTTSSTYTVDGTEYTYMSGYTLSDWKDTTTTVTNDMYYTLYDFEMSRTMQTTKPMSYKKTSNANKYEAVPLDQYNKSSYDIEWPTQAGPYVFGVSDCCSAITNYAGETVDCGLIIAARVKRRKEITGSTTATNFAESVYFYLEMVPATATISADAATASVDFDILLEMKGLLMSHMSWVLQADYPDVDIYPTGVVEGGQSTSLSARAKREIIVTYDIKPVLVLRDVPFRARVID
jgi:hypothetical protein